MADQYIAQVNTQLDQMDVNLRKNQYIHQAASKTGVRPSLIIVGAGGFLVLFILAGFGARFLTNLVGFTYPVYASFKALKTKQTDDDTLWLTYWVVYGLFSLVESATDLFMWWIPFYNVVKMVFLVYLYAPQTKGAQVLFQKFVNPLLTKYEGDIDRYAERGGRAAQQFANDVNSQQSSTTSNVSSTSHSKAY